MKYITVDMVACIFLGLALLSSIYMGASSELSTNIASGLIGFMGKIALDHAKGKE